MFNASNLKANPYISIEMDFPHLFVAPPVIDTSCSDWLYLAMENDEIDKIYAMRVLPLHDIIALKIKYTYESRPESTIINRPELALLKRIWNCNNTEFNKGIVHYLQHSKHACHQFGNKSYFPSNTNEINSWYYNILLGKDV